jgi:hypothetical protein
MSFLDHPSLQQSNKDRNRADKRWTPPTARGILEDPNKPTIRTPQEIKRSFEERMLNALTRSGKLQLRVKFDLLEPELGKDRRIHHHYNSVPGGRIVVKVENQGRLLKLIEEIKKLGVDFVNK